MAAVEGYGYISSVYISFQVVQLIAFRRMPASMLGSLVALALTVSEIITKHFKMLTFKKQVKVMENNNFSNDTIPWQMLQSTKNFHTFLRQLLPFQRYKEIIFDFQEEVKVMKCNFRNYIIQQHISKSSNVSYTHLRQLLPFQIYKIFIVYHQKVSQDHRKQFSKLLFDG